MASSGQLSNATQQKQAQFDQATANLNATLKQIQQEAAEKATDRRAGFQHFVGYKFQDIPDHLWEDFEFECLALICRLMDMGRQQQQSS